jgi:hypothetical protein
MGVAEIWGSIIPGIIKGYTYISPILWPMILLYAILAYLPDFVPYIQEMQPIGNTNRFLVNHLNLIITVPTVYILLLVIGYPQYAVLASFGIFILIQIIIYVSYPNTMASYADNDDSKNERKAVSTEYSKIYDTVNNRPYRVSDYFICSSYKSASPFLDTPGPVMSADYLKSVIRNGARMIWLDVFRDSLKSTAEPVIAIGDEAGNKIISINTLSVKDALDAIVVARNEMEGNNTDGSLKDPLFIMFSLKTNGKTGPEDKLAKYIKEKLGNAGLLMPKQYGSQNSVLFDTPITEVLGRVVIMTDKFTKSKSLNDLVNYVVCGSNVLDEVEKNGDPKKCVMSPAPLGNSKMIMQPIDKLAGSNMDEIFSTGLSSIMMSVPNRVGENYDPTRAWFFGTQFVFMHMSNGDNMGDFYKKYMEPMSFCGSASSDEEFSFKKYSLVVKPSSVDCDSSKIVVGKETRPIRNTVA